jgi:hypothetical protein
VVLKYLREEKKIDDPDYRHIVRECLRVVKKNKQEHLLSFDSKKFDRHLAKVFGPITK